MATIAGTNISAQLVPYDSLDISSTHESKYGRGGWFEVGTITERNEIPQDRLRDGCACYVRETELPYKYENSRWNVLSTGNDPLEGIERYVTVTYTGNQINISAQNTPYAKVCLEAREENPTQYLNVYGASAGESGKILVIQSGNIPLQLGKNTLNGVGGTAIQGEIRPIYGTGSLFIVEWRAESSSSVHNQSFIVMEEKHTNSIEVTQEVDFYVGSTEAVLSWIAPKGYNSEKNGKKEFYDLRYSETPVSFVGANGNPLDDEEIERIWGGMNRCHDTPVFNSSLSPSGTQIKEYYGVRDLFPSTDYYFAIRLETNIGDQTYVSIPSVFPKFRTTKADSLPNRIKLVEENLYPQVETLLSKPRNNAVDESGKALRIANDASGIALMNNPESALFNTYWHINEYSKSNTPYDYVIDLHAPHIIDSLFIVTSHASIEFNVYVLDDLGYGHDWTKLQTVTTVNTWAKNPRWTKISFENRQCRFIRFSFECLEYRPSGNHTVVRYTDVNGHTVESNETGAKGFLSADGARINDKIPKIEEIVAYGRKVSGGRPSGIYEPVRKVRNSSTVDEFISANDQGYHQGRLSGLYANPYIRQYMADADRSLVEKNTANLSDWNKKEHLVHWNSSGESAFSESDLRSTRFRLDKLDWVTNTSGLRDSAGNRNMGWKDALELTYKNRGLKPFCTATTPLIQLSVYYADYGSTKINGKDVPLNFAQHRPMDLYFTNNYNNIPYPVIGFQGWKEYFKETENPQNYKMMAKLAYCIAKKYGKVRESVLSKAQEYMWAEESGNIAVATGNDLLSGMEFFNEPDNPWKGFCGYMRPLEFAAIQSAVYDGHCGELSKNKPNWYGVKNADPNFLSIMPGFITLYPGYLLQAYIWWKTKRTNASLPFDIINTHCYFSTGGNQDLDVTRKDLMGCSVDYTLYKHLNPALENLPRMRDIYMPDKPIWITEMGWGEAGKFQYMDPRGENSVFDTELKSIFQVRSLDRGKYYNVIYDPIEGYNEGLYIPSRFRADIKGQYFIRGVIQLMNLGYDMCHWYMTENEKDWFDTSKYGRGPGMEMFHWEIDETGNLLEDKDRYSHNQEIYHPFMNPYDKEDPKYNSFQEYGATKFSGTGLFGNILHNGGYPISRAFWWIKTFKERFTGYTFVGFRKVHAISQSLILEEIQGESNDEYEARKKELNERYDSIVVACFKKEKENKDDRFQGAYVVYYFNSDECETNNPEKLNRGLANVKISVPYGTTNATCVRTYVPTIRNPKEMELIVNNPDCSKCSGKPADNSTCPSLLNGKCYGRVDRRRTALPTSRYERWNGTKWETLNPVYMGSTGSPIPYAYTKREADHEPENKKIGDLRTILPSLNENPFFPLVGPVGAVASDGFYGGAPLLTNRYAENGSVTNSNYDSTLAWRQVDAICDYIEMNPLAQQGCRGIESSIAISNGYEMTVNVTEEPVYYFFDAIPERNSGGGNVSEVRAVPESPTSIRVWWNNTDTNDAAYQVYYSKTSESNYRPYNTHLNVGDNGMDNNNMLVDGLEEDTQYFFKVRPIYSGGGSGSNAGLPYAATARTTKVPVPDVSVSARSTNSITLSIRWGGESGLFRSYQIFRSNSLGEYVLLTSISAIGTENAAEKCYMQSYSNTNLTAGKSYSYKIRAIQSNGQSALTEEVTIKTLTSGQQADSLVLNSITLGDNTGSTLGKTIPVNFSFTASITPQYYLLSEDPAFEDAEWKEYSGNPVTFTLSDGVGSKKIYARMRLDKYYMESNSANKTITLSSQGAIIAIGFDRWLNDAFLTEYGIQTISLMKETGATEIPEKNVKNTIGNDFGKIQSVYEPYVLGETYQGDPSMAPATGKLGYPDQVFKYNITCKKSPKIESLKDTRCALVKITVPAGTYKVKLFGTTKNSAVSLGQDRYFVGTSIYQGTISSADNPFKSYNTVSVQNNFTNQLVWGEVKATSRTIYVGWFNTQADKCTPLNTIELEKIG